MSRVLSLFMVSWLVTATAAWLVAAVPGPMASDEQPPVTQLFREGETVELVGRIQVSGDRATFYPAEKHAPLRVLENLALERVSRLLAESPGERQWLVSGTVTEYRGANYLLMIKAVQRAQTAPKR